MTYFNSEYNYDKEVPKDSSPLSMFTHVRIVLFFSHAYYMVNSKLSS